MNGFLSLFLALLPFASGALIALIGLFVIKKARKKTDIDAILRGDDLLVATAIEEVGNVPAKVTYLEVAIKIELRRLTTIYTKCNKYRMILGSIYLVTGFISIAITGTNASLPGIADTVKFSFAVNIIGEIASGFLIFGGFEGKAETSFQSASLIRLEIAQFIGQTAEYFDQPPDVRWFLLTQSVEAIVLRAISMNTIKKIEKEGDGDSEGSTEESPVVRPQVSVPAALVATAATAAEDVEIPDEITNE